MRRVFLLLLICVGSSVYAQVTSKFMGDIYRQYQTCISSLDKISGPPSSMDTANLIQQVDRFNAMANSVYEDADLDQKKALLYYTTILQIRTGYVYVEGRYWADAYDRFFKPAVSGMKYITQSNWFPVTFQADSLDHTINRSLISDIEYIFYNDLLNSALRSGRLQGADEAYGTITRTYKMPQFNLYVASDAMITFKINEKKIGDMSDDERYTVANLYADHISSLGQFAAADKQRLFDYKNTDFETRYKEINKEVMELVPLLDPKRNITNYENIGMAYLHARDTAKARNFFMIALNSGYRMETTPLEIAANIAVKTKDKEMGLKIIENIKEHHDSNPYELETAAYLYSVVMDDKKSANKYYKMAKKAKKHY